MESPRITIRRPPPDGLGDAYPITVFLDGARLASLLPGEETSSALEAGPHRLRAHNTLLAKTVELDVLPGEALRFVTANRRGRLTTLLGFLGTGPLYVTLARE